MGVLNRGETFAAGEEVTAARLHRLVENATLVDGSVSTIKIADGAVTAQKLASGVQILATQVTLPNGKLMLGNASNVGSPADIDGVTIEYGTALGLKDAGVTTAKIADDAVTQAKIADLSPSPAGTFGTAAKVPVITVSPQGLVTGVTEVSAVPTGRMTLKVVSFAGCPAKGAFSDQIHNLTLANVASVQVRLIALSSVAGDGIGYATGDHVDINAVWCDWQTLDNEGPALVWSISDTSVRLTHVGDVNSSSVIVKKDGSSMIGTFVASHWQAVAFILYVE